MEKKEQEGAVYLGDCLNIMKNIPSKSIDMILCDLPYGITQNKWDTIIPLKPLWDSYMRIAKDNAAIVLTANQPFSSILVTTNIEMFKYQLVWDKRLSTGFLNAKKQPLRSHEDILVFYKKQPTYNPQFFFKKDKRKMNGMHIKPNSNNYGCQKNYISKADDHKCYPLSILSIPQVRGNSKEKENHPTQKPVALFEWLIKAYSNEGDMILDNCAGSGTTAIAAINTNRKYICIEQDEVYFNAMSNRINNHIAN